MSELPKEIIEEDRYLDESASIAGQALASLRWHWTLDETNTDRVSFRAYARAVGVAFATVRNMATGYAAWRSDSDIAITLAEAIERAKLSTEKEAAVEAVAEARGLKFNTAAQTGEYRREAATVLDIARDRAERRGTTVEEEIPAVAEFQAKASRAGKSQRAAHKARHGFRFIEVEGHLARAKSLLTKALAESEGVNFTDEETDLLRSTISNLKALLGLVDLRITGAADIDWDAELAALEGEAS